MIKTLDLLRRNPVQAAAIAIVLAIVIGVRKALHIDQT
jgi:hypothetical protein